jgi:Paraquat-inducible protein A
MRILLVLISLVLSANVSCATEVSISGLEAVRNVLGNLTVYIPDQHIDADGFNVTLDELECHSFALQGLNLTTTTLGGLKMSALLYNFDTTCFGRYDARKHGGFIPVHLRGNMSAAIGANELGMLVAIGRDDRTHLFEANAEQCVAVLEVTQLNFTNALLEAASDRLVHAIDAVLKSAVDPLVCDALSRLVDVNLTAQLNVWSGQAGGAVGAAAAMSSSPKFDEDGTIISFAITGGLFGLFAIALTTVYWTRRERRLRWQLRFRQRDIKPRDDDDPWFSSTRRLNTATGDERIFNERGDLFAATVATTTNRRRCDLGGLADDHDDSTVAADGGAAAKKWQQMDNNAGDGDGDDDIIGDGSLLAEPEGGWSMVLNSRIWWPLCYLAPLLLLFNIGLFLSSNLSVGASVYVVLASGGVQTQLPSLFSFTLANSVVDMWRAHVYPLAILIALFSGTWPYLKLVLMLLSWLAPTWMLPVKRRERLLMALDALGKWSLIDAYVLVMMLVAFRLTIAADDLDFTVDVWVDVNYGFYSFLAATMMSLLLTHVTLAVHRRAEEPPFPSFVGIEREALADHRYDLSDDREGAPRALNCTLFGKTFVVSFLIATVALVAVGSWVESFAFEFRGLVGAALGIVPGQGATTDYSVVSLGNMLPTTTLDEPNGGGIRWLQATFFTFTLAVPLVHLVSLLLLWVLPLSHRTQHRAFVIVEILNAWSALEVFIVSLIAALLEIQQFAQFIIGDKCVPINNFLLRYFDKALDGDAQCFDVVATLLWGCWVLFLAVIFYMFVGNFLMRMCHKALGERLKRAHERAEGAPVVDQVDSDERSPLLVDHDDHDDEDIYAASPDEVRRRLKNDAAPSCFQSFWRRLFSWISSHFLRVLGCVKIRERDGDKCHHYQQRPSVVEWED